MISKVCQLLQSTTALFRHSRDPAQTRSRDRISVTGQWSGQICVTVGTKESAQRVCYEQQIEFFKQSSTHTAKISSRKIRGMCKGALITSLAPERVTSYSPVLIEDNKVTVWLLNGNDFKVTMTLANPPRRMIYSGSVTIAFKKLIVRMHLTKKSSIRSSQAAPDKTSY